MTLDRTCRALCRALALVAVGRLAELHDLYAGALADGVAGDALREGARMAHLFGGVPRAIEAFRALSAAAGGWPVAAGPEPPGDGDAAFRRVYGAAADPVRAGLHALDPTLESVVLQDAYGRILSRPGLDPRVRELMAVTALTASGLPRQLESHLRGALRCGASASEVREAVLLAAPLCDAAVLADATGRLDRLAGEAGEPGRA